MTVRFGVDPSLAQGEHPGEVQSFDQMMERWFPLSYVLNNLHRSLCMADPCIPGEGKRHPIWAARPIRVVHERLAHRSIVSYVRYRTDGEETSS